MTNPFETPASGGPPQPPAGHVPVDLDVGRALRDGLAAFGAAPLVWIGVVLVLWFLQGFTTALCCSIVFFGPVLAWGVHRFAADAQRGRVEFGTLFSGFQQLDQSFLQMILLLIVLAVLGALAGVVTFPLGLVMGVAGADNPAIYWASQFLTQAVTAVWMIVALSRFLYAPYLLAVEGMTAFDALAASWNQTNGQWGRAMGVKAITYLSMLPGQYLMAAGMLAGMPAMMSGMLADIPEARDAFEMGFAQEPMAALFTGLDPATGILVGGGAACVGLMLTIMAQIVRYTVEANAYVQTHPEVG